MSRTPRNETRLTAHPETNMSNEVYTVKLTASRTCRRCDHAYDIEPSEPFTGTVEEIAAAIPDSIADQQEEDGWVSGNCPMCAFTYRKSIDAESQADAERENWEDLA